MLHIGCHLSSAKGLCAMGRQALALGADTFQFFTRNPRGSRAKALDAADADALTELLRENRFAPIIAHAPYTLNLCGAAEESRRFAQALMRDDVGQGVETGIAYIAEGLNAVLTPEQTTTVLLETMAGKGTEVGSRFEELREIWDRVEQRDKVYICLDTCHVSDAGYDLVHDLDGVLTEFDRVIGLDRLRAVHLNDSLNPCGSHKDRHARIGEGQLGLEALTRIVTHPALRGLPFCLETPNDLPGYAREIALMRDRAQ